MGRSKDKVTVSDHPEGLEVTLPNGQKVIERYLSDPEPDKNTQTK